MAAILDENQSFQDVNGKPLVNGFIYVGEQNADPVNFPIDIFANRELTSFLPNPQRTDEFGRSINKIWVDGRFSIEVQDENAVQRFSDPDAGEVAAIGSTALTNVQGVDTVAAGASPAITNLVDKQVYIYTAIGGNIGPITLKIDGTAIKDITYPDGRALESGDVPINTQVRVQFNIDEDRFEWISFPPPFPEFLVQTGDIKAIAGSVIPDGYLLCDGATLDSISDTSLAPLFSVIGFTYGGDGPDNFDLPSMVDRVAIGAGNLYSLGTTGGSLTTGDTTLTIDQIPAHTHSVPGSSSISIDQTGAQFASNNVSGTSGSEGGGNSHNHPNTVPPFNPVQWIIKK